MAEELDRRDFMRLGFSAGAAAGVAAGLTGAAADAPGTPAAAPGAAGEGDAKRTRAVRLGVIGTGGRGTHMLGLALAAGVEVPALCDIKEANLNRAINLVAKARDGRKPAGFSGGPKDYRRMLQRDDLEAVLVTTPMQLHAEMSIDALRAGKHVLSEVAAAMTVDECWGLVRAAEETGKIYMLSENCCYWPHVMTIGNMVAKGLFGEPTFAECGYVHDCRSLLFEGDGTLTWRGEMARDFAGNVYPTHSLGPVAQWLGVNRGDRLVSLVAAGTGSAALGNYVAQRFGQGHPARSVRFKLPDSTTVLVRTAKGVVIDLRFDMCSPGPYNCYHTLQGLAGRCRSAKGGATQEVWLSGKTKDWAPVEEFAAEYEHPLWARFRKEAEGTGHGGADFFVLREFLQTVRAGAKPPIDACDAAAWSAIIPLSCKSIAEGGAPQQIPDFTRGKWQTRKA